MSFQSECLKITMKDNVAVALKPIQKGEEVLGIIVLDDIPQGHKIAIEDISYEADIIKYGFPIGSATKDILKGSHVHTHNIKTNLSGEVEYKYEPVSIEKIDNKAETFMGYLREDNKVATRNEIWIIPTVGCVNGIAQKLVSMHSDKFTKDEVEGIYTFPHPFGCSQMGEDHEQTRKILANLVNHPNAGAVLVLGLGCENNTVKEFKKELGEYNENRVKFLVCQDVEDEFVEAEKLLCELFEYANKFSRQSISVSELIIGMKCGGSDGFSGITANPTVGAFSDKLISRGGTTVLTEVPEMFGAEEMLMNRCVNKEVFNKSVKMINDFKNYFLSHNQVVYENPSPGNKDGGISTLEDKSLGCVQKGGTALIQDVLDYGETIKVKGLNMLSGPGNDLVSSTAMTAAGAHIILFTTGRGTPFGAPVPTIKISSNSDLFKHKNNWIDFDTGKITSGETIDKTAEDLMNFVFEIASGKKTKTEENGYREISIFKNGVTL